MYFFFLLDIHLSIIIFFQVLQFQRIVQYSSIRVVVTVQDKQNKCKKTSFCKIVFVFTKIKSYFCLRSLFSSDTMDLIVKNMHFISGLVDIQTKRNKTKPRVFCERNALLSLSVKVSVLYGYSGFFP